MERRCAAREGGAAISCIDFPGPLSVSGSGLLKFLESQRACVSALPSVSSPKIGGLEKIFGPFRQIANPHFRASDEHQQIGRAHVRTPVTNAHHECPPLPKT